MIYFRCYLEDYDAATADLSATEDGIYFRLLRHYYRTEKPIPIGRELIISRAMTAAERKAMLSVLSRHFTKQKDGWHNERANHEIAMATQARSNGAKGGNPWVKEHYNEPGFLYAIRAAEDGEVKVGITVDPARRLSEHRRDSGCREEILIVPVTEMGKAEASILATFADVARGEWLKLPKEREGELTAAMEVFRNGESVPSSYRKNLPKNGAGNVGQNVPEPERGLGQPNKPTSTKSPNSTTTSLSNHPSLNRCEGASPTPPTAETWEAYSTAYRMRYGTEPVRNARVNGQLANLVARLGASEAPQVAVYYLTHNRASYVRSNHAVGLLLADAEGLRTEWATSRKVSDTEARQADRTMATGNAFAPLIEQAKREAIA